LFSEHYIFYIQIKLLNIIQRKFNNKNEFEFQENI
jgi:hypothetical protein